MRSPSLRKAELAELKRVVAVWDAGVGLWMRKTQDVLHVEDRSGRGQVEGAKGVVVQSMTAHEALLLERHPVASQERRLLFPVLVREKAIAAPADHRQSHSREPGDPCVVEIVGKGRAPDYELVDIRLP